MIRLAERTWREAARLAADPRSVVLLPLGDAEFVSRRTKLDEHSAANWA